MAWAPDYATLDEVKGYLRIPLDDLADDADLNVHRATASRNIDRFANRQFGKVEASTVRYYTAQWDRDRRLWSIPIDDVHSSASFALAFDSLGDQTFATAVTSYLFEPLNAAPDGRPWTSLRLPRAAGEVAVTDAPGAFRVTSPGFGWANTPVSIKEACLLQTSRYFARRNAPFGIAGSPEIGSEMRLLNKLDPDVEVAVGPYRRVWGAV